MTITSVQIIDMFEKANDVEKKLPPAIKNGMASMRFDVVNDATEHAAWHKAKPRFIATANEIAIFEYVLFYLNPMLNQGLLPTLVTYSVFLASLPCIYPANSYFV